jgi:hypothetical protein
MPPSTPPLHCAEILHTLGTAGKAPIVDSVTYANALITAAALAVDPNIVPYLILIEPVR